MSERDYEWRTYYVASPEHLQALGVISLNFNRYENGLMGLLSRYMSDDLADLLFDKLDNNRRQKLIRELIASREPDPEVREHIECLVSHFSTCSDKRNILLHARVRGTPSEDVLPLEKNDRNEPGNILAYDLKVGDLRRAADEMRAGYDFMRGILDFLIRRDTEKNIDGSFSSPLSAAPKSELPKKPPPVQEIVTIKHYNLRLT